MCYSGDNDKGEGGDFRLEVRNRQLVRAMGPGAPTGSQWRRVCRCLDDLMKVCHMSTRDHCAH